MYSPAPWAKRQRVSRASYAGTARSSANRARRVGAGRALFQTPRPRMSLYTIRKKYMPRTPGGNIVSESHYFDSERTLTSVAANDASWTGTEYDPNTTAMLCLFAPVIGDDIFNRTGRKVFVKKINIVGQLTVVPGTVGSVGETPAHVRLIVYCDKQTNTSQSQGEDLIESGAASDAINMFQSTKNFGRFKVLKDQHYTIGRNPNMAGLTGAFVSNGDSVSFHYSLPVNMWVNYNAANGGTVADIVDNSFHLIANTNVSTQVVQIQYKVRTTFSP